MPSFAPGQEGRARRYALHYHLVGDTMRGSSVIGASIWDSHNRWLTIHGTNYLVVRDCVGYKSVGHGFFFEDGTEVFNVLDRNLAVGAPRQGPAKQVLPFRPQRRRRLLVVQQSQHLHAQRRRGQRPVRLPLRGDADQPAQARLPCQQADGSFSKVDVRTLPFVRFEATRSIATSACTASTWARASTAFGPDVRHPFIVRDLKIWDVH